jgi:hypothetical protein
MPLQAIPQRSQDPHIDATRRLGAARADADSAHLLRDAVAGTPSARHADAQLSRAHAEVATLEEWVNWVDHGASLHPEADGEWGRRPLEAADARTQPRIHRCSCGNLLLVVGVGRHRVFFHPGNKARHDPVMDGVCPECGGRLPGKSRL